MRLGVGAARPVLVFSASDEISVIGGQQGNALERGYFACRRQVLRMALDLFRFAVSLHQHTPVSGQCTFNI